MTAKRPMRGLRERRRARAATMLAAALTVALVGACTPRQAEDILYAAGKIAYDSMKARQHGE